VQSHKDPLRWDDLEQAFRADGEGLWDKALAAFDGDFGGVGWLRCGWMITSSTTDVGDVGGSRAT
jgi:hypothetical protein